MASTYQAMREKLWRTTPRAPTEASPLLSGGKGAGSEAPSYGNSTGNGILVPKANGEGPAAPAGQFAAGAKAMPLLEGDLEHGAMEKDEEHEGNWGSLSKDWASACCICFVVLLGDSARGIMFPTLWPRVSRLGGNRTTHGYMVGSFSLGRALSSPLIGQCSERYGFQQTLAVCSIIIAVGGYVYAFATGLPALFLGQVLIGVGSGSLGVTRAYIAELSSPSTRTVLLAYLTAVQYCGFTCTPFIGALLSMIFGGKGTDFGLFTVNQYNAPGHFTGLWAVLACFLLVSVFQEPAHSVARMQQYRDGTLPAPRDAVSPVPRTPSPGPTEDEDEVGCFEAEEPVLFSLLFLNVATKGSISCFETLGAMFAFIIFDFDIPTAGQLFAGCGAIGVVALLLMRPLTRCMDEVQLILGGVGIMAAACLLVATLGKGSLVFLFYVTVFSMYSVGYPIGHTAVIGVFSQVAEGKSQGALLSWFGTAGSLARIFFPMLSGFIAQTFGFSAIFTLIAAVLLCTFISVAYGRKCLRKHMGRNKRATSPL